MASYEPEAGRVVVEIGFDGPDRDGITENLQMLCHFFTTRWQQPDPSDDFEWLQVEGGLIRGIPVRGRAFVIPPPNQGRRRAQLLSRCDAIVFVSRARPRSVAMTRVWYESLWREWTELDVPVVLQARREGADTLEADEFRALVADDRTKKAVGLQGRDGEGVRETFASALRLAADRIPEALADSALADFAARVHVDATGSRGRDGDT